MRSTWSASRKALLMQLGGQHLVDAVYNPSKETAVQSLGKEMRGTQKRYNIKQLGGTNGMGRGKGHDE